MFIEDVHSGVMPVRLRSNDILKLEFQGPEEDCQQAESLCASISRHTAYGPTEAIEGAIEDVVLHLAFHGIAFFEILRDKNNLPVELSSFNSDYVWSVGDFYLQLPPRRSHSYPGGKKYAILRHADVFRISMPNELSGPRGYRRILNELSEVREFGPKFLKRDLEKGKFQPGFSVPDYHLKVKIHQYYVTRKWGWNQRDWSLEYVTEFYQFYRFLTSKWAHAVLREHVIFGLNQLFSRLRILARISVRGFPTPSEILATRDKLVRGEIDFSEVSKRMRDV